MTTTLVASPDGPDPDDGLDEYTDADGYLKPSATINAPDALMLLTTAQAAQVLGLSPSRLRQMRNIGLGPAAVRLGRTMRYRPSDVTAYQESRTSVTDGLISTPELSKALSITRSTIAKWVKDGILPRPARTVDRCKYFERAAVEKALSSLAAR